MPFEKVTIDQVLGFEDALEGALNELEARGLGQHPDEPPVTIIIRTTGRTRRGQKEVDCMAYIGGVPEEISFDFENTTNH